MSIMPMARTQSKTYHVMVVVIYVALAGALAYRGYQRHDKFMMALAAGVVLAAVFRLVRALRMAPPAKPDPQAPSWYTGPKQGR
jgi:uncharacterized membrane protein YvlD (DUF360 family)